MSEDDIRLWPDGSPVTPWADPWHDTAGDVREAMAPGKPEDTEAVLWMLDQDKDGWPVRAHRITEELPGGERVTACGLHVGLGTRPRGWWMTEPGKLPLQAHAVHCGKPEGT